MTEKLYPTELLNEPTRDKNLLDLVLTTNNDLVNNVMVGEPFSDHNFFFQFIYVTFNHNLLTLLQKYATYSTNTYSTYLYPTNNAILYYFTYI